jgi:hypothetical protein
LPVACSAQIGSHAICLHMVRMPRTYKYSYSEQVQITRLLSLFLIPTMGNQDAENQRVLLEEEQQPRRSESKITRRYVIFFVAVLALFQVSRSTYWPQYTQGNAWSSLKHHDDNKGQLCPQAESLSPSANNDIWKGLSEYYATPAFLDQAVDWLGGAVKIP